MHTPSFSDRRAMVPALVLGLAALVAACGAATGPSGSSTAAPASPTPASRGASATPASPGPVASGAVSDWELENLGIHLVMPDGWVRAGDATSRELEALPWTDALSRHIVTDGWQRLRTMPGWDTGVIAGDPASGTSLILRFVEDAHQGRALDELLADIEGTDASDVSTVRFLGREAIQAFTIVSDIDGVERIRLGRVGTLADGRTVSALFVGPSSTFDTERAIAALDGATETGVVPLGAAWDRAAAPELEALLRPVGGDQLLSGDLLSMVAFGAVQGNDLLSVTTTIDRVLADPTRIQAAITGPASGRGATVTAIRWTDEPADLVSLRNGLVDGLAYTDGRIGSCEALLAPASDDAVEAVVLRQDLQYWIYGTATEVDRTATTLLDC